MVFHITYKISPGKRNEGQKRFKDTGALPPAGVTMIELADTPGYYGKSFGGLLPGRI
jgi:hypothetical protein